MKKTQAEIIQELQNNSDVVILNNTLSTPKFVRKLGIGKEMALTEVYTPKLFYDIISKITPEHLELFEQGRDTVKITVNIGEFLKSVEAGSSKNLHRHIINCIDLLQTTQVKWKDGERESGTAIITHYDHFPKQGKIDVVLYKEFVKQVVLLTQNEHFSFLKKHLLHLRNAQAIKLFPFLVSWRNRGTVELYLDVFKRKFGYDTKGYKKFSNLKSYVLEPSLKEINEKTDLSVTYELLGENLKSGKPRITGLRFLIQEKSKQKALKASATEGGALENSTDVALPKQEDILAVMTAEVQENLVIELSAIVVKQFGVSLKMLMGLAETQTEADIRKAIELTQKAVQSGKLTNIAGFFVEAVRGKYQDNEERKKVADVQMAVDKKAKADAMKQAEQADLQAKQTYSQREGERKKNIILNLIEADSDLVHEALAEFKNGVLGRNYDETKTVADNLQSPMVAGVLMSILEKLDPTVFK